MKRVLILGGGFGGIETYVRLHKELHPVEKHDVQIQLINRTNYFTYLPMLHEAATGSVAREHVVQPIREILKCCGNDFHQATITDVDPEQQVVHTNLGEYAYDYLIVALGVKQGFFGTPGAAEHALALKWLPEAVAMRNRIINSFERASEKNDADDVEGMRNYLHFVIVGGGATGTELAGQLSDLFDQEMERFYGDVPKNMSRITLVHAGDRVLQQLSEDGSRHALERLQKLGVDVRLNELVTEVTSEGVQLKSGEFINSKNVFWTAGTESAVEKIFPAHMLDDKGLIKTTPHFQADEYSNIFALGDCARIADEAYAYPPTAQAAVQAAHGVAYNVRATFEGKELKPKKYQHKGDIIPVGDWYAIFELNKVQVVGRFAWWLRRTVFLKSMYSWAKRLQVLSDWNIRIFLPRDTSEF